MKILAVISTIACLAFAGPARSERVAKNKGAGKPLPSYEEVLKTYPEGRELCDTDAGIVGGGDERLLLDLGHVSVRADGREQYRCYGTKLTVKNKVTLKGKTYPPETKLTVDKKLDWIVVSGWEISEPKTTHAESSGDAEAVDTNPSEKPAEALAAPSDVAAPPKNAIKTASGLAYVTLTKGSGKQHPSRSELVRVHYSGWTTKGKLFDSSVVRGEPAEFRLDSVIAGWREGVRLMVVGDKTRFWIPGDLAYGETSSRPGVPTGMLVFDIELLEIKKDLPDGE